jgi:hypothetical protein
MLRILLGLILVFASIKGSAQLMCRQSQILSLPNTDANIALKLDALNQSFDHKLFSEEMAPLFSQSLGTLARKERAETKRKIAKLKAVFKELRNSSDRDDLLVFAHKIDQLAFLKDPAALQMISKLAPGQAEIMYSQARRSLMTHGLENFFLERSAPHEKPIPRFVLKVWKEMWKTKYWRWSMVWISIPELRNAILPPDLALNVLMHGTEAYKAELAPYQANAYFKSYFNILSAAAHKSLIVVGLSLGPALGYAYYEMQQIGASQMAVQMQANEDASKKLAESDFAALALNREAQLLAEEIRQTKHREPTRVEWQMIQTIVGKKTPAALAASSPSEMTWIHVGEAQAGEETQKPQTLNSPKAEPPKLEAPPPPAWLHVGEVSEPKPEKPQTEVIWVQSTK